MEHKTVAIAIPYYKNNLTPTERISLNQCLKMLGSYDTYFVSPKSLNVNPNISTSLKVQKFDDEYFTSIQGYNKLMLSEAFYQRFAAYDYVLIYQLDAFVFRDELQSWADKGYDYIGAPWIRSLYSTSKFGPFVLFLKRTFYTLLGRTQKAHKYIMYNNVGNGGLSLRYVKKMVQITHKYKNQIARQLEENIYNGFYPEDLWLACELKNHDSLKKPSFKEALSFAFDVRPQLAFQLNNHQLPFACHGFNKPKEGKFWVPIITDNMIPKIIHLCWFSNDPYPVEIKVCLDSWRRLLPDYKIKVWRYADAKAIGIPYIDEALEAKRWAFAADVVRVYAVWAFGGVYMDSDIFLYKRFDEFLPTEDDTFVTFNENISANDDACGEDIFDLQAAFFIGTKGNTFCREVIDYYASHHYRKADGTFDDTISPRIMRILAKKYGYKCEEKVQKLGRITVYPTWHLAPSKRYPRHQDTFGQHRIYGSWKKRKFNRRVEIKIKHIFHVVRYALFKR